MKLHFYFACTLPLFLVSIGLWTGATNPDHYASHPREKSEEGVEPGCTGRPDRNTALVIEAPSCCAKAALHSSKCSNLPSQPFEGGAVGFLLSPTLGKGWVHQPAPVRAVASGPFLVVEHVRLQI